jgi:hypothetical protein
MYEEFIAIGLKGFTCGKASSRNMTIFSAQAKPKAALQRREPRKRCKIIGLLLICIMDTAALRIFPPYLIK